MIYIATAVITLILDQITKGMILAGFSLHESRIIIENILHITYVTNQGGAFSLFSGYPMFFVILSFILIAVGLIAIVRISKQNAITQISLGLLLGGTAGNLIDRLRFGAVIDFIDFRIWPTFNVADMAICAGVGILSYIIIKSNSSGKDEPGSQEFEEGETEGSNSVESSSVLPNQVQETQ